MLIQSSSIHRYVEQSNLLMEQRNHSLQTTTENTQARVLHAEQEKVMVTMSRAINLQLQPGEGLLVALKCAEALLVKA